MPGIKCSGCVLINNLAMPLLIQGAGRILFEPHLIRIFVVRFRPPAGSCVGLKQPFCCSAFGYSGRQNELPFCLVISCVRNKRQRKSVVTNNGFII